MKMNLIKTITIIIILIGLGLIITAFIDSSLQMQIALVLGGIGFICLGLMQVKRIRDGQRDEERFEQIMTGLEQIRQALEKEEQPKGKGIAIADVITSGLKYYAEHLTKPKQEEEND